MSRVNTEKAKQVAYENGVANPSGALMSAFAAFYLAAVPLTSYMTKPDGIVQKVIETVIGLIPGGSAVTQDRMIPAIAAMYVFWTFGGSGAVSAAGQNMGRSEGIDNWHPRKWVNDLDGLPLRMRSAHYGLLEQFGGWAVAAALAQSMAPGNQQIINLLGFHAFAKMFVFYPVYLLNIAPPRTLSHVLSTGAVINVCWRLATGAR